MKLPPTLLDCVSKFHVAVAMARVYIIIIILIFELITKLIFLNQHTSAFFDWPKTSVNLVSYN